MYYYKDFCVKCLVQGGGCSCDRIYTIKIPSRNIAIPGRKSKRKIWINFLQKNNYTFRKEIKDRVYTETTIRSAYFLQMVFELHKKWGLNTEAEKLARYYRENIYSQMEKKRAKMEDILHHPSELFINFSTEAIYPEVKDLYLGLKFEMIKHKKDFWWLNFNPRNKWPASIEKLISKIEKRYRQKKHIPLVFGNDEIPFVLSNDESFNPHKLGEQAEVWKVKYDFPKDIKQMISRGATFSLRNIER